MGVHRAEAGRVGDAGAVHREAAVRASTDTTIALVRLTIRMRRELVDALKDKNRDGLTAIAEAFEEDIAVLEHARDALVDQAGENIRLCAEVDGLSTLVRLHGNRP